MPAASYAIFHADASVTIGGGHVRRCLVLADALAEAGWDITFVCGPSATAVVPALARRDFNVIEPLALEPLTRAPGFACALLVVDDYRLDAAFESRCRAWAERIFVVDDLANRRHDCDVLLDQSPGRLRAAYVGLVPPAAELLVGPSYALLDRRFRAARRQRKPAGPMARIFVNFGTTDTANATQLALDAIAEAKLGAAVDVVLGSTAPHLDAIRKRIDALGPAATLHLDVDDMASLMLGADLAIGAGGVGSLERCALGLPSLVLTVADNQLGIAAGLGASGAAVYLGDIASRTVPEVAEALQNLAADAKARQAMSATAQALVDGLGAARARLSCYSPQRTADGRQVTLRQLTLADAPAIATWLAQATSGAQRWLQVRLDDPDCVVNLVLCDEKPAGVLRLDRGAAPDTWDMSVLVALDHQGLGLGRGVHELARRFVPGAKLLAPPGTS